MSTRRLVQNTIQSNRAIQNALAAQATRLEAQLKDLDQLIESVNKGEELPDEPSQAEFQIPGSKRAIAPIPSFELFAPSSPFCKEASQRAHYVRWTSLHPMKGKEAEVLADAVKKENMRLEAYRVRDNSAASPIDTETNVQGIDWSIVAEKVSDYAPIKRTPDECRIQWVAKFHPKINHGEWMQDELNRLHDLTATALATGQKINWSGIAKELGTNRIPIDCMKQAITRPRHHWDTDADQKLLEAVQIFGTNNWNLVARHVSPYATTSQCQKRYVRSLNPSIKHEPWTPEEDTRLRKAVDAFNNSWIDIAGVLPGRTNDQCRERWAEIGITEGEKGLWSEVEDQQLLGAVKELGKKWKMVSGKLGSGRTGPNCRLRYDRLMKKQAKQDFPITSAPNPLEPASMMQIPASPTEPASMMQIAAPLTDSSTDHAGSQSRRKSNSATSTEGLEGDKRPPELPSQLGLSVVVSPKPRHQPRPLRRLDDSQPAQPQTLQTVLTMSEPNEGTSSEIHHENDHVSAFRTQPQLTATLSTLKSANDSGMASCSSIQGNMQPRILREQDKTINRVNTREKRNWTETELAGSKVGGVADDLQPTTANFQRSSKRQKVVPAEPVQDEVDKNVTTALESRLDRDDLAVQNKPSVTKSRVKVRGESLKGGQD